jgi:hypothetical protein
MGSFRCLFVRPGPPLCRKGFVQRLFPVLDTYVSSTLLPRPVTISRTALPPMLLALSEQKLVSCLWLWYVSGGSSASLSGRPSLIRVQVVPVNQVSSLPPVCVVARLVVLRMHNQPAAQLRQHSSTTNTQLLLL